MCKRLVAFACLALLSAASAVAGRDDDAVIKFGLLGTWAVDCAKPPSPDNPHTSIAASWAGHPRQTTDIGTGYTQPVELRNVRIIATDRLALLVVYVGLAEEPSFQVILARVGARFRSHESVRRDGVALIREGRFVDTGDPTPLFERCSRDRARLRGATGS